MDQQTGKYLMVAGLAIVVIGFFLYFFHDSLKWLGRLPGDIRIEKDNSRIYFPWVTMLVVSLVLTIVINIIRRFL